MKKKTDSETHKGHRARMRRKFSDYGPEIFDTYELLEMLLYSTIAAKDTNPIAKALLNEFGSLNGVLCAKPEELMRVNGVGAKTAQMISAVGQLGKLTNIDAVVPELQFDDYDKVGEYFVNYFGDTEEQMIVLMMLDSSMNLLGTKTIYKGHDYKDPEVKHAAFAEAAISLGTSVVMIAHNHPGGSECPSAEDIEATKLTASALSKVGITVADHYLIGKDRYFGFMAKRKMVFSQRAELRNFYITKEKRVGG